MESFATTVTLLLGFVLLSGGGVLAVAGGDCEPTTFPVRGAANQLVAAAAAAAAASASACTTHSAHLSGPTCDAPLMASQMTKLCDVEMDVPGALCCAAILITVEQDIDCLCRVAEAAEFDVSDLSVARVWEWYKSCGGHRRSIPQDKTSCKPGSAPPPPPPPAAKPEAPSAWPLRVWLAVGLLCAAAIATAILGALKLWLLLQIVHAPTPMMQDQHQDVNDVAVTGAPQPQLNFGPGDAKSRGDEDIATGQNTSGSREKARPPVRPLRVKGRSQVARARLPSPAPFEPPPPLVVPLPPETMIQITAF